MFPQAMAVKNKLINGKKLKEKNKIEKTEDLTHLNIRNISTWSFPLERFVHNGLLALQP